MKIASKMSGHRTVHDQCTLMISRRLSFNHSPAGTSTAVAGATSVFDCQGACVGVSTLALCCNAPHAADSCAACGQAGRAPAVCMAQPVDGAGRKELRGPHFLGG